MDEAEARRALLRQEAIIAIVMNALISIAFFFLIFGWRPVETQNLALDFLPQSAGVTFLGTLVPSLITYSRIRRGKVVPAGPVPSRGRHLRRILAAALFAVIVFGGAAALVTTWLAPAELRPLPALILKASYGGALGFVMIPPVIRAMLGMPMFGRADARLAAFD